MISYLSNDGTVYCMDESVIAIVALSQDR